MRFYITGRRAGKTEKLVREFLTIVAIEGHENVAIITPDMERRNHIKKRIEELGGVELAEVANIYSASFPERVKGARYKVLVDDVDGVLRVIYGDVTFVTGTGFDI